MLKTNWGDIFLCLHLLLKLLFHSGKGIGSLVTGKLFDPRSGVLGEVWTFRAYSFLALVVLVIYAAINILFFRHRQSPASPHLEKADKQSGNGKLSHFMRKGTLVSRDLRFLKCSNLATHGLEMWLFVRSFL